MLVGVILLILTQSKAVVAYNESTADQFPVNCTRRPDDDVPGITLDCYSLGYYSLPGELPTDITGLDMSYNRISHFCGFTKNYTNLRKLDMSRNQIVGLCPGAFAHVQSLTWLSLRMNPLNLSLVDEGIFSPLNKTLTYLNLGALLFALTDNRPDQPTPSFDVISRMEYRPELFMDLVHLQTLRMDALPQRTIPEGFHSLSSLTHLELSGFPIVFGNDMFKAFVEIKIQKLSFKNLFLKDIEPRTYDYLSSLQFMSFDYICGMDLPTLARAWPSLITTKITTLHLTNLIDAIKAENITTLSTKFIQGESVTQSTPTCTDNVFVNESFFQGLEKTNISHLVLSRNNIKYIEPVIGKYLPNLRYLSLSYNHITVVYDWNKFYDDLHNLKQLSFLDISHQVEDGDFWHAVGQYLPDYTSSHNVTIPNSLRYWNMSYAQQMKNHRGLDLFIKGVDELSILNMSNSDITFLEKGITFLGKLKNKITLYMDSNNCNKLDFAKVFANKTSSYAVRGLSLYNNDLDDCINGHGAGGLIYLKQLQFLDLSKNRLTNIPNSFFTNAPDLEDLRIGMNALRQLDFDISALMNLKHLDLSYNLLTDFTPTFMSVLDSLSPHLHLMGKKLTIDIEGNPFVCSCETLSFLKWANARRHMNSSEVVLERIDQSFCSFENEKHFWNESSLNHVVRALSWKCNITTYIIVGSVILTIIFLTITLSAFAKRHKWEIKFWFINNVMKRKDEQRVFAERGNIMYDAFVAYHEDDLSWIRHQLLDAMEDHGITLCLHHRDFLPGTVIEENIIHSIKSSRKTLLVISGSFLHSEWCQFEVQMARAESFDAGRDVIIPILMEPIMSLIEHPKMTTTLRNVLRKRTYLDWAEACSSEDREHFFERLRRSVRRGSPHEKLCECGRVMSINKLYSSESRGNHSESDTAPLLT